MFLKIACRTSSARPEGEIGHQLRRARRLNAETVVANSRADQIALAIRTPGRCNLIQTSLERGIFVHVMTSPVGSPAESLNITIDVPAEHILALVSVVGRHAVMTIVTGSDLTIVDLRHFLFLKESY